MVDLLELLQESDQIVLRRLRMSGQAWIVGGWVRDALSGLEVEDLDIATTLKPNEVAEIFPRSIMVGEIYGTVRVRLDKPLEEDKMWEVTTLRTEGGYGDGRRPDNVEFGELIEADLARRDFTINAIAIDDSGGLIDPFGGIGDLEEGVLRSVGDASERIGEDGLRILRTFRFLDWGERGTRSLDEDLEEAVRTNLEMLDRVSKERIWSEISRILSLKNVSGIVEKMGDCGVFGEILTGISLNVGVEFSDSSLVNLALLCSADDRGGRELAEELRSLLRISNDEAAAVGFLHNCRGVELANDPGSVRRFRAALPRERQIDLLAYITGLGRDVSDFVETLNSTGALIAGNAPLVDGNLLSSETGLDAGVRLGRLKAWLHRRQIEEDIGEKEEILSMLEEIHWEEGDPEKWPILSWP